MEEILLIREVATQEAGFWFNPLIILATLAGGPGGLLLYCIASSIWRAGDHLGMAVLGMPQSGKTIWYNYLLKRNMSEHTVDCTEIREFKISFSNGKSVVIKKGKDIGGQEEHIETHYSAMIEDNDIILFFFNIEEYLGSKGYERDVNARLDFIYSSWKEKKDKDPSKAVYLIMTYINKMSNPKESRNKVLSIMRGRSFSAITKQHIAIDATDNEQLEELKRKIFNNGK